MKNISLFLEACLLSIKSEIQLFFNPHIVICAWCKKVLHAPKAAGQISHGICWLCYFKERGGKFPHIPRLKDFAIWRAFRRHLKIHHDELWQRDTIQKGLRKNGWIIESRIRKGESLTDEDRQTILAVRGVAHEFNIAGDSIRQEEWHGAEDYREWMKS